MEEVGGRRQAVLVEQGRHLACEEAVGDVEGPVAEGAWPHLDVEWDHAFVAGLVAGQCLGSGVRGGWA